MPETAIPGDYYARVVQRESGGNPNAKNPRSSASGLFQFTDSTFLNYARKRFPGMADGELMAMKNDPEIQRTLGEAYTNDSVKALTSAGLPVNNASLYLSHFAGQGGAVKVMTMPPNTPVGEALGEAAVKANPHIAGMTTGDLMAWAGKGGSISGGLGGKIAPEASDNDLGLLAGLPEAPDNNPSGQMAAMGLLGGPQQQQEKPYQPGGLLARWAQQMPAPSPIPLMRTRKA